MTFSIIKVRTEFGGQSDNLRSQSFSENPIVALQEDAMQVKLRPGKYGIVMKDAVDYCKKCDLCQRMGQPIEKDRMPFQPVYLWSHSKNGDWILLVHLNQQTIHIV